MEDIPDDTITEEEVEKVIKQPSFQVLDFIKSHPYIIYKGLPLAVSLYFLYPFLLSVGGWLPVLWSAYHVYSRIPPGVIPISTIVWRSGRRFIGF